MATKVEMHPMREKWQESKQDTFAYKMMKKMGWDEGKGLGKNEDGINTHITVSKKSNNLGLGASNDLDGSDGWNATSMSFSAILASLNQSYKPLEKEKKKRSKKRDVKLEKVSISLIEANVCPSRAKRVRAKNIRALSENDLKAIFGHAPSSDQGYKRNIEIFDDFSEKVSKSQHRIMQENTSDDEVKYARKKAKKAKKES